MTVTRHPLDDQDLQRWRMDPPTSGKPWPPFLVPVLLGQPLPEQEELLQVFGAPGQRITLADADQEGRSLLHWAAIAGDLATVRTLAESLGADPFAQDRRGDTVLHKAVRHPFETAGPLVRLLRALGAEPTVPNQAGDTVLDELRRAQDAPLLEQLQRPVTAAEAQQGLWAALTVHQAIRTDAWQAVVESRVNHWLRQGANAQGSDPHPTARTLGRSPLHQAFHQNMPRAVQALLRAGAPMQDPPASDENDGWSLPLLHDAVWRERLDMVRSLLSAGAPVNEAAPSADGNTPLHLALRGARPIVQALLDAGANPTLPNDRGVTVWSRLNDPGEFGPEDQDRAWTVDALVRARMPQEQAELRAALAQVPIETSPPAMARRPSGRRL